MGSHCPDVPWVLSIKVSPVLFHIFDARMDPSQVGMLHIGVYILLLLSGQRNFAVRLNKVYDPQFTIPVTHFEGNFGDLILLVVHGLMTGTNARMAPLYNCLLTILVNISPYLKQVSLVAANKLVHLFEVFSSPKFILAAEANHHLIFFLLETFNNLIQYQFEGNHNLVYVIIRRRAVFSRVTALTCSAFTTDTDSLAGVLPTGSLGGPDVVFDAGAPDSHHKSGPATTSKKPVIRSSLISESKEHFSVKDGTQGGFVPRQEWMDVWQAKLPLETIQRMLYVLVPQVERLCVSGGVTDEAQVLKFLKNGTLVGLLPVGSHQLLQFLPIANCDYCPYLLR